MSSPRPQRQSWRHSSAHAGHPHGSKRNSRWILTLLSAALIAVLVWMVWGLLGRADRTHVVALVVGNHAKLSVPSLPFGHYDLDPLKQYEGSELRFNDWSHLLESDRIGQLGNDIERLNLGKKDTLIVYLSAHGLVNVFDDDKAQILCRDFDLSLGKRSGLALDQLLNHLERTSAERTLLVLDTGYLPSDARLGFLVNEFPRRVQQAVENSTRPELWVMLSSSICQSNTVTLENSLFGQSFVKGLLGAANVNGDRQVDLLELFQYVAGRCQRESGGLQTVQIMRSGLSPAEVHPLSRIPMMSVSGARAPEPVDSDTETEPAPTDSADTPETTWLTAQVNAEGSPAVTAGGDKTIETPDSVTPNSDAEAIPAPVDTSQDPMKTSQPAPIAPSPEGAPSPGSAPRDASATDDPEQDEWRQLRARLDEAWRLRDQLQEVHADRRWIPLEYAPHLWRELNRLLLDSERWLLRGPNRSLALQIEKHIDGLRTLYDQSNANNTSFERPVGDLVTDRLVRAQADFVASPVPARYESPSATLSRVADDVRSLNRMIYTLPDFVHWYTLSSFATPDDDDQLDEVLAKRIETLLVRCRELRGVVRQNSGRPLTRTLAAQIQDDTDQLSKTYDELGSRLRNVVTQAAARPDVPGFRRQLHVYLQTSLPPLDTRKRLRSDLASAEWPDYDAADNRASSAATADISRVQWQRILRRCRFETELIHLADEQFSMGRPPSSYQDTDEVWRQLQELGSSLQAAYSSLDHLTGRPDSMEEADRVRMIDGRDAPRVSSLASGFPPFEILPPRVPAKLSVSWVAGSEMPLSDDWRDLPLEVTTTSSSPISVALGFQFDESSVQLRTKSGRTIRPGSYPAVDLQATRRLDLQVRSKKAVIDPGETTERLVHAVANAGSLHDEAILRCLLPRPDDIEMIAVRLGANEPELSFEGLDQTIQLRCFPDRTTRFRLQLRNVSGSTKSVHVRVLAVPTTPRMTWPPGRILGDDQRPFPGIVRSLFEPDGSRVRSHVAVLAATTAPIALGADGNAVDVDFRAAAAPSPGAPDTESVPTPEETPVDTPAVDISSGLVFVIEEEDKRWLKWIELKPIPPRDYVKVDVAYDLQRLNIFLQPRTIQHVPFGLEQQPIPVQWEIDRLIEDQLQIGDRIETGAIAAVDDRVQLYADVDPSRDRDASVRLAVDRYPRAFIFELPLDQRSEQDDPRRDLPELVIQSVSVSNFPRVYVWSEAERRQWVAERESDDEREVVVLPPGQPAAFPKPDVGDQMVIRLRADAAVSAFGRADVNDRLTIEVKDRLGVTTFRESRYADREATFSLLELAAGRIAIRSDVRDHRIVTNPQRMEGDYQLLANMVVGSDELSYPRIPIIFDGQVPRILRPLSVTPARVDVGKPFEVSFEVEDESGLAKIEVGLVKKVADALDEKKKVVLENFSGPLVRVRLTTDEPGKFWVKAVVADGVGKSITTQPGREFQPIEVQVDMPASPPSPGESPEIVGRVFGVTQIRSRKIDRIQVALTGDKEYAPVSTSNGGQFEFLDVPAGTYELVAEGYWNGERVGRLPIQLKQPADYRPFVIQLQAKPRDDN